MTASPPAPVAFRPPDTRQVLGLAVHVPAGAVERGGDAHAPPSHPAREASP